MAIEFFSDKSELNPEAVVRKRLGEAVRALSDVQQGSLQRTQAFDMHFRWLVQTLDEVAGDQSQLKQTISRQHKTIERLNHHNTALLTSIEALKVGFPSTLSALRFALNHRKNYKDLRKFFKDEAKS